VEGTSVVIEGAHVVPGFFDLEAYQGRVLAVPVVVTVDDEDLHRSHFAVRSADAGSRPFERYMRGFKNIRRVQKYIKSQALTHGVPAVPNYSLDQSLSAVIDLVLERANDYLQAPTPERSKGRHPAKRHNELEASAR
jgi:2-phosphoglycerate kinase